MAIRTTYSSENLVIETGLSVWNSVRRIYGNWEWTSGNISGNETEMWEAHRYARMSFRYVGMTDEAAEVCQADIKNKYTRSIRASSWDGSVLNGQWIRQSGGRVLMTEVSKVRNEDGSFDVVVNVNEDDVCTDKTASAANDFATEDGRIYESL